MCHQYDKLDGAYFAKFVQDNFNNMFRLANKNGSRLFVPDNCPVQDSALQPRTKPVETLQKYLFFALTLTKMLTVAN